MRARAGAMGTLLLMGLAAALPACGPVPRPADAYASAPDLIADMARLRSRVRTLRLTGRVDHFGEEHRIQGRLYLFADMPDRLRVDLLSPFGNTLSVLTVDGDRFAMSDLREERFMEGPALPCNIARLVRIPLPPEDVARIISGGTPLIEGAPRVGWDRRGFYTVAIDEGRLSQALEVGPDRDTLFLRRSTLTEGGEVVFDIRYERWLRVGEAHLPHEISVRMPAEKADLLLRYDEGGVEVNVKLPDDAWRQAFPDGATVEQVTCQ